MRLKSLPSYTKLDRKLTKKRNKSRRGTILTVLANSKVVVQLDEMPRQRRQAFLSKRSLEQRSTLRYVLSTGAWERDLIMPAIRSHLIQYKTAKQETYHAIQRSLSLSLSTLLVPT